MQPNNPIIKKLAEDLKTSLPTIATNLIKQNCDMTIVENRSFADNPNNPLMHSPSWHQYGIIEHSLQFLECMNSTLLGYVDEWGIKDLVLMNLSKQIDGISKLDLLKVVALLHDLGKFTTRKTNSEDTHHFTDHEIESGKLIRDKIIKDYLLSHGLTSNQIEYIARCAELHFELGKLREVAKQTPEGYSMSFFSTKTFINAAQNIIDEHPDFALEIGILFIADSKSKSDIESHSKTDEEIQLEKLELAEIIKARGLNEKLLAQSLQMPVNLYAAEAYLKQWAMQFNN